MRAFSLRDALLYSLVALTSGLVLSVTNIGRAQEPAPPQTPPPAPAPAAPAYTPPATDPAVATPPAGPAVVTSAQPAETPPSAAVPGIPVEPQPLAPESTTPDPDEAPAPPDTPIQVEVGGGMILLYVQPLEDPDGSPDAKPLFEIFEARLRLDAKFDRYRIHITPRFRDTKERGFFPGESWVEEAWAGAVFGPTILKVGKIYAQFGKFWDNSFYGNTQEFDGLKLDLGHGVSWEGKLHEDAQFGLNFYLQYFVMDGTTNYALPDRDTHTYANSHRRNQLIARAEPVIKLSDDMKLVFGASAMYFRADLAAAANDDVGRLAIDATFTAGGLGVWAEYSHQFGRHVAEWPVEGGSDENQYVMVGGEYTYDWFTVRYNFNMGIYSPEGVDYSETRHVPGISATLTEHLVLFLEWAYSQQHVDDETLLEGNNLFFTVHGKF